MDFSIVITAIGTVFAVIGSNVALFLWARSESRSDYRECRNLIDAIHEEMKDFHGRLCSLEARWHDERTPKKHE